MKYNSAIDFLLGLQGRKWELRLEKIKALLKELGNPHQQFPAVHIAGTNGKGSTAAMLESIFRKAGYRTGLYTSPHLIDMRERIKINGEEIDSSKFSGLVKNLMEAIKKWNCTFFEAVTAIAFVHFANEKVDIAFIETGLGGRLDATNVIYPLISIITEVDLDHAQWLGNTKTKVAMEKAGIIKNKVTCVSACEDEEILSVLANRCRQVNARFVPIRNAAEVNNLKLQEEGSIFDLRTQGGLYQNLFLALAGDHQIQNAITAMVSAELLSSDHKCYCIAEENIRNGLAEVRWPARLQLVKKDPKILLDVAHNPSAMRALAKALRDIYQFDRLILIMGVLRDKDYAGMVKEIIPFTDISIAVEPKSERALDVETLATEMSKYPVEVIIHKDILQGLFQALTVARSQDLICVTGSHFTVGEVLKFYKKA